MSKSNAARKASVSTLAISADVANDDTFEQDEGRLAIEDAMKRSKESGEPVVVRVSITPATASWLLATNENNRRQSEPKIIQYTDDIAQGRWMENGDGIAISKCNALNNGQHRLMAIQNAGIPITTNVTVGLERAARKTNDIGLPRTLSALLAFEGVPNATIIGAMTKLVIGWESTGTAAKRPTRENSIPRVIERIMNDSSLDESTAFVRTLGKVKGLLSKAQIGFFHYVLKDIDQEAAETFLSTLVSGQEGKGQTARGLLANDPRWVARTHLVLENDSLKLADRVEIVFKAWNAWRQNKTIKQIDLEGDIPDLV
jgi:hypothetical protein